MPTKPGPFLPLPVWQCHSYLIWLLPDSCEHSLLCLKSTNFPPGDKPDSTGPHFRRTCSSGTSFQAGTGLQEKQE